MSGGAWEYVMGNYNDMAASSGFRDPLTIYSKYYDKYVSHDTTVACNGGVCTSHALSETAGWYSDAQTMVSEEYPWLVRGCSYFYGANAGVFNFSCTTNQGVGNSNHSFRLVMSVTS